MSFIMNGMTNLSRLKNNNNNVYTNRSPGVGVETRGREGAEES